MNSRGIVAATALAAVASLMLNACADDASTTEASGSGSCATEPVKVGFINKLDTDPYWQETKAGAEDAVAELGGSLVVTAPSKDTGDAQVEFINNLVAQQVGVIVIAGNNPDTVAPALKRAQEAGVKVISYDSDVATDARTVFVNQADLTQVGTMLIENMSELIGGKGQVAALIDNATATNQVAWVDSIKEALASDPAYKDIELVTTVYGESNEATSQQQTVALLNAYPDLKGIIVPSGLSFPAAARAVETAGQSNRIKMNGLAPASIMKKYIESGQATDVWWNVHDLGYLAYAAAQAVASCKLDGETGQSFTAGDLGDFTVADDGTIILGPATLVTAENVNEFKF